MTDKATARLATLGKWAGIVVSVVVATSSTMYALGGSSMGSTKDIENNARRINELEADDKIHEAMILSIIEQLRKEHRESDLAIRAEIAKLTKLAIENNTDTKWLREFITGKYSNTSNDFILYGKETP